MKHGGKWLLAGLAVVVLLVGGMRVLDARRAQQAAQQHLAAQRAQPVVELATTDVVRAELRELQRGLPISGSLKAVNSALVKARVPGELQGLTVREGDPVRAGQVIARIDAAEGRARLQQAQRQADAARAQVEIAQRQYENNRALVEQGFISRAALDTSASNLSAARATHEAALAAADLARKGLDDTVLRAPISGVVSQRFAQPGERIPVEGRVVEIVDLRELELEASLGAADSMEVRIGQQAVLEVEGSPRAVTAKVARINPSAQPGSRSVLAYLLVADAAGLRQGLFAQGTVAIGGASGLAVPLSAVRTDQPRPYVQVVEDERVVHKAVEPGVRGDGGKEIWVVVTGLEPGALVIRGHVGPLRAGTAAKFTQAASAAVAGRAAGTSSP